MRHVMAAWTKPRTPCTSQLKPSRIVIARLPMGQGMAGCRPGFFAAEDRSGVLAKRAAPVAAEGPSGWSGAGVARAQEAGPAGPIGRA